ncbi:MAG: 5-formyltetrahydrofolate cyclo-ligase [Clostridia bacterium]
MEKKETRKKLLSLRGALKCQDVEEKSAAVCRRLKEFSGLSHVMVYLATGNECNLSSYISYLMEEHCSVYVPVCTGKGIMEASLLVDPENDLEEGTFGILAPKKETRRFVDPEVLDAVIVPGVGFDKNGARLGFGGGFYDRYLPRTREECQKIAVCYELQLLENVYPEPHDFPMDFIITEKAAYSVSRG